MIKKIACFLGISFLIATPLFSASLTVPFRPSDIPTGLVGYWKFNNGATDSSGKGYDLTGVNTPAYIATDYWKSGEYSANLVQATPTYYTLAHNADIMFADGFTISFWINGDDVGSAAFLTKGYASGGYLIQLDGNRKVVLYMNNGARATSNTAIVEGKWWHIVVVYNQVSAQVYLNGNLDVNTAYSTDCTGNTTDLTIGTNDAHQQTQYDGRIKDLAMWNVALTPVQIKSLAMGVDLATLGYRPDDVSTPPVAWWKLNEPSGDAVDYSGNTHTGTDNTTVGSGGGFIEGIGRDFEAGDADNISVADHGDFDFSGGVWTISAWIKPETADTGYVFSEFTNASNHFRVGTNADGKIEIGVASGGTRVINTYGTTVLKAGTWYHCVWMENGNAWDVYLDGVKETASGGTDTDRMANFTGVEEIGSEGASSGDFDGIIADLAVWKSYNLTDAEIASLASGMPIQQQGIISYWKMDEASGNALDSIGTNTGVETSGTIDSAVGKVGTARDFEAGDTEYFLSTNSDSLDIASEMAISFWVKPESVAINATPIDKDMYGDGYGVLIGNGNKTNFYIGNDYDQNTTAVAAATWIHIVGNYDGILKGIWSNAILEGSGGFSTNPADTTSDLYIGASTTPNNYLDGLLDEVILAKRFFRAEEIKNLYIHGTSGKAATSSEINPSRRRVLSS